MKKIIGFLISASIIFSVFGFDWPQENVTNDSYSSYFGQKRGDIVSTSLIFSEKSPVSTAENGNIIAVITEESDDTDFFPSTLGTAVILSHDDNLLSVYGNLDTDSLIKINSENNQVKSGTVIGKCGENSSGWQEDNNKLEFQIVDTNNNSAINPKILMPRSKMELPLSLSSITLQNKNGNFFDLNKTKSYQSGLYRIYQKRNKIVGPYRTSVAINGVTVDQITYDTITQENGKSCVTGKKKYTSSDIYPNDEYQLIGEVNLTPGKATLTLRSEDMLSNAKQLNYNITIY